MKHPDPYPHEKQRLESLQKIRMMNTPVEERFDKMTQMVCQLLDVPIALFNLIDDKEQFYKSAQGVNTRHAPLEGAFCSHAFNEPDILLVPDAKSDERFHDNPFVTGDLNVGFYAGCPVRTPDGMPVGTVCAIDTKPREMSKEQLDVLREIAVKIEKELKVAYMLYEKQLLDKEFSESKNQK